MKKIIALTLITITLISTLASIASASDFGVGVDTLAEDVKVIKTGLLGRKMTFNDSDIKQALCISDFEKITITRLPNSNDGTLLLAGRRVGDGTSIKRKNLPSLVFIPASREVTGSSFAFTVDGQLGGAEIEFVIKFIDKVNYEPTVEAEYRGALFEETQRNIKVYGKMVASDGEGDELEYIIVSYPKHGMLTNVDKKTGEYLYTPPEKYVGQDSFVYVVRDEYGNFSKTEKVTIEVSERLSEVEYTDMIDRPEYSAAVSLSAMGVMGGRVLGDDIFFDPDLEVSRAEFVAMAMKSLGIQADSKLSATYFDDNADIPRSLVGYIATAQKKGVVLGEFKDGKLLFKPNDTITRYDAAVVMANLIGAEAVGEVPAISSITDIPVWARPSVYAMCAEGIFDNEDIKSEMTANLTRADTASYLYKMIKSKEN